MSKISDLNQRLASYVEDAEAIKEKIKNVAIGKEIEVRAGEDTPLTVLDKIDNIPTRTSVNLTESNGIVTASAGYYAQDATKALTTGVVSINTTTNADIDFSTQEANGHFEVIATVDPLQSTVSISPTISTPGYIASGAGTISSGTNVVSGTDTFTLDSAVVDIVASQGYDDTITPDFSYSVNGSILTTTATGNTVMEPQVQSNGSGGYKEGYISNTIGTKNSKTISINNTLSQTNTVDLRDLSSTLISSNIIDGVTIFGVTGDATVANLQAKTEVIIPNTQVSTTTIRPDSGYNGMSSLGVTVSVPTASVTVSGSATRNPIISVSSTGEITATNLNEGSPTPLNNISPLVNTNGYVTQNDVMAGSVALSGTSTSQLATLPAATIMPTTSDQTIPAGKYLTGIQTIKGDDKLISSNIISGVSIFGVQGSAVVPSGNINITTLNSTDVTNYATAQVVDANLIASNIKEGVSVLGLTGTFTSDADAASGDIISGKTAYVNGTKITGNIPTYDSEGQVTVRNNGSIASAGKYFENDIIVDVSSGGLNINGEIIQATVELGSYVSQGDFVSLTSENPYTVREYNSLTDMGLKYGVALQSGSDGSTITVSIPYTNYTVDNNLGNCTTNNSSTTVRKNSSYSATITPDSGYSLENAAVTIRMGGVDITSTAYNNGVISIATINGDLTITVVCGNYNSLLDSNDDTLTDSNEDELIFIDDSWSITQQLTGCFLTNGQSTVEKNNSYTTDVYPSEYYTLNNASVSITMGGLDISTAYSYDSVYEIGSISIPEVTGDVVIEITATAN